MKLALLLAALTALTAAIPVRAQNCGKMSASVTSDQTILAPIPGLANQAVTCVCAIGTTCGFNSTETQITNVLCTNTNNNSIYFNQSSEVVATGQCFKFTPTMTSGITCPGSITNTVTPGNSNTQNAYTHLANSFTVNTSGATTNDCNPAGTTNDTRLCGIVACAATPPPCQPLLFIRGSRAAFRFIGICIAMPTTTDRGGRCSFRQR